MLLLLCNTLLSESPKIVLAMLTLKEGLTISYRFVNQSLGYISVEFPKRKQKKIELGSYHYLGNLSSVPSIMYRFPG